VLEHFCGRARHLGDVLPGHDFRRPPGAGAHSAVRPDPTRESLNADLLAKHTRMPVVHFERDSAVEADHADLVPPNTTC